MKQETKVQIVLALIGPPGCGKGTQGMLLSEKLRLYYFETSKILEERFKQSAEVDYVEADGQKYYLKDEHQLWLDGILCSPPFVSQLVREKIRLLHAKGESIILSGSPRTLYEAETVFPLLTELYGTDNVKVIFIDLSPEETIFRNSNRRICELMRHPILFNNETASLTMCCLDGSQLVKRKGLDDPKTIKTRLKEFEERTLPIIDFCSQNNLKVLKVNGEGSVTEIFERINTALKS